jgi:hypothetical protein
VFREGEQANNVYIIRSGDFEVTKVFPKDQLEEDKKLDLIHIIREKLK